MNLIEENIEQAQKITLGQVDNGTLATAVTCGETLAIARHGRVESYLVPKYLLDEALMKIAVLECDNKRLLGEKVEEPVTVTLFRDSALEDEDRVPMKRQKVGVNKHAFKSEMQMIERKQSPQ